MPRSRSYGRIRFLGNPWPDGHAVTAFSWTARVECGSGIWFDLHLETEAYGAADDRSAQSQDVGDDEAASDWESRTVWCNYRSCTLSSTAWPGQGHGFLVATKHEPLDMRAISKRTFCVDDPPVDLIPPRPFNIYLTGHDTVASHRIAFRREARRRTFSVDWRGRIASSYAGSTEFKHEFEADLTGVSFGGIVFPGGVDRQDALSMVQPFVDDLRAFRTQLREGRIWVIPT